MVFIIIGKIRIAYIPVLFEGALASLAQPNHIVHLCSGASLAWRLHASSIPLGISSLFEMLKNK